MATLEGFAALMHAGKIRYFGVSNFDVADMEDLWSQPGGSAAVTDQVLYNLTRRGIEWDLLPWCRARPADHGLLADRAGPAARPSRAPERGRWHGATAAQVALARVLRRGDTIATPRAGNPRQVREYRAALDLRLTVPDLAVLDRAFPPPGRSRSRCSKLGACRPNKRPA